MAFTHVSGFTGNNNKVAGSSWASTLASGTGTTGVIHIISLTTDNITTTDGNTNDHQSLTDSNGNIWRKIREFTNGQGSAAAGITVSFWWSKLTSVVGTLTWQFSGSITAKAYSDEAFSVGTGKIIVLVGATDLATDGASPASMTISGLANKEHLWLRVTGTESSTATGPGANYTVTASDLTSGGGAATNVANTLEYRIFTGTSDTAAVGTNSADHASIYIALDEYQYNPPIINVRQAMPRSSYR